MEFSLGIEGADFVLTASDCNGAQSIVRMKEDLDKSCTLGTHFLMTTNGEAGDATNFGEYIQKNIALYKMNNGYELTPHSGAHFVRRKLAEFLRSRTPYQVNILLSGYDNKDGPSLYHMDYLGAMVKVPFATHGYGGFFSLSTLDRHWKPGMTLEESLELLQKALLLVQKRFIVHLPKFSLRVVNKDGIRLLGQFTPESIPVAN